MKIDGDVYGEHNQNNTEKPMRIYTCDDSAEGIFTAVYEAGISGYGHKYIRIEPRISGYSYDTVLFAEYIDLMTDTEKAECVMRSVRNGISYEVYNYIMKAVLSSDPEKATLIYHFVTYGFSMGAKVASAMQIPCVAQLFKLVRNVNNEIYRFIEILRFQEVGDKSKVLFAVMEPRNYVLSTVTNHFADRFNCENFIIYDKSHGMASVHICDREGDDFRSSWEILILDREQRDRFNEMAYQVDDYVELWKIFFESIAVQERKNSKLQNNMIPLYLRKHMTEFRFHS